MAKKPVETPMMKQFNEIKEQHPDAILLFRVGDFYETFCQDAIDSSEILGITLTKRANGSAQFVELAGFPHHSLDNYLPKLVRAGRRVAICDQLEDPKTTKTLVKRGVTELVTPGVSINDNTLNHKENNFLCAVHFQKKQIGLSLLDISTGEFLVTEGNIDEIDKILASFAPKEILVERNKKALFVEEFGARYFLFEMDDWHFNEITANERLTKQFETTSLKGFGVQDMSLALIAAGAILYYMDATHHHQIEHITSITKIDESKYMQLDKFTVSSLELVKPLNEGGKSLMEILDRTMSPMGTRLLRRWIIFPLKERESINRRLDMIDELFRDNDLRGILEENLCLIGDLERLVSKIATGRMTPRDVLQLKIALDCIAPLQNAFLKSSLRVFVEMGEKLNPCPIISTRIAKEINPDAPNLLNRGNIIASGVNQELDELRQMQNHGKEYLLKIQQRESEATGISSLKISFNNVFGYFIEVRNIHKDKVPDNWIRKQTLVNAERYITQELKEYEEKILSASDKILILENSIYSDLITSLMEYIPILQTNANLIAQIDCLLSFALVAKDNKYVRPEIDETFVLDIKSGRHPVIERQLPTGEKYIENDVFLDPDQQQIMMITGPNMAGKSALLRQTALIVLMAQIGCFVPAESAKIGIVDRIFTRVGASDNISMGESTFMVEMNEASYILNNISERSLILFDELGRGTSTYDGISIAWAIVEYLHENTKVNPKTLFATHYHELNDMEKTFHRIKNFNVSVRELDNKVIFLRKLVVGGSEHSFGIHVAKMAGMPKVIVKRADEILGQLEKMNGGISATKLKKGTLGQEKTEGIQLSFFQLDDPVLSQIKMEILNLDVNNLTPIEALNKLNEIKKILGN